jgi:hypothetical protein
VGNFRVYQGGFGGGIRLCFIFRYPILSNVQTYPPAIATGSDSPDTVPQTSATLVSTLSTPPTSLNSGRGSRWHC